MPHSGAPLGRVRILLVEDSELDAELLIEQLLEAGLDAEFLRVDGAEDMRAALAGDPFDLVLSDMELPGFSGYQALEILREHDPRLPFVFFSGTIGEVRRSGRCSRAPATTCSSTRRRGCRRRWRAPSARRAPSANASTPRRN